MRFFSVHLLPVLLLFWLAAGGVPKLRVLWTTSVATDEIAASAEADVDLDRQANACIVFSGVHRQSKGTDVFFRTLSTDKKTGAELVRLSEDGWFDRGPSLAVKGNTIHCAWLSYGEGDKTVNVVYRHSLDGGREWRPFRRLPVGESRVRYPTVVAGERGLVFLLGSNQMSGKPEQIYLFRSEDNGETWNSIAINYSQTTRGEASEPQLVFGPDGTAYLIWLDSTPGSRSVIFCRSEDRGQTWSAPVPINDDLINPVSRPVFCVSGDKLYVSWILVGNYESSILFDISFDSGKNWGKDQLLYRENVTQMVSELQGIGDGVLLAWRAHWNEISRRGESLNYKWRTPKGDWVPGQQNASLSLYGEDKNLSFKEFEILPLSAKRTVAVFTEIVDEKAVLRVSISPNLAKGFTGAVSLSQRTPGFEFRFPRVRRVNPTTFLVLHSKLPVKRFFLDPSPPTGGLLMSLVRIRE